MSQRATLVLEVLPHGEGLSLPAYTTAGAAGLDLRAALASALTVVPGARVLVPTGRKMSIAPGFEGQVRARSGLAWRQGLAVLNAPGTIDSDYRGEVKVILVNLGQEAIELKRGDRIAQLVIAPVLQAEIHVADSLESTQRGAGGFGSTGTE